MLISLLGAATSSALMWGVLPAHTATGASVLPSDKGKQETVEESKIHEMSYLCLCHHIITIKLQFWWKCWIFCPCAFTHSVPSASIRFIIIVFRKYNAHVFQPNIYFKIGMRIRFKYNKVTFKFIVSCATMCRERSRFSAQFVPEVSQPRAKTRPPTVVGIFVITRDGLLRFCTFSKNIVICMHKGR